MGYHRAGFDVVGVDIEPQPYYPFPFIQGDAMNPPVRIGTFDAIHASPPCQHYSTATAWRGNRDDHPDLVAATREMLQGFGLPYVIENVPGAPLAATYMLCGTQFGLPFRRHRLFEVTHGFALTQPCHHRPADLAFEHKGERAYADALGCEWMPSTKGRQAIPPVYTEFIGREMLAHMAVPA